MHLLSCQKGQEQEQEQEQHLFPVESPLTVCVMCITEEDKRDLEHWESRQKSLDPQVGTREGGEVPGLPFSS